MVKRGGAEGHHLRALKALTREVERLRTHTLKILQELHELRRHMAQLYIDLAPLDPRNRQKKPVRRGK